MKKSLAPAKQKDAKRKVGAPKFPYSLELAQEICGAVATSLDSLKKLCDKHPHWPNQDTIRLWRWEKNEFAGMYARAKSHQAELAAEELMGEAREKDYIIDEKGNKRIDPGFIASQRLIVDTQKWISAKLAPRIYGTLREIEDTKAHNEELKAELLELQSQLAAKNTRDY